MFSIARAFPQGDGMGHCDYSERCCYRQAQTEAGRERSTHLRDYCQGELYRSCERRRYFLETGTCAPFHLTPSGENAEGAHDW